MATRSNGRVPGPDPPRADAISSKPVAPVTPYVRLMPKRNKAEAKDPSRKYLIAPSFDAGLRTVMPTRTYEHSVMSSKLR